MPPPFPGASNLLPAVRAAAEEAGRLAHGFFRPGRQTTARIWSKAGGSPVTEADVAVDTFLKVRLSELAPEAAWLSEETVDRPDRLGRPLVWIVDPIDGTRAFLSGHPDWSVAIALLMDDEPVLGLVFAPAHGALYEAVRGEGASRDGAPIRVSGAPAIRGASVAGPKPLVDRLDRAAGPVHRADKIPSLALRIARVAEGAVDLGLVSTDARDWDIAGAHLVLAEAGGRLAGLDGRPPVYNRPEPVHGELAATPAGLQGPVLEAMAAHRHPAAPSR